MSNELRLSASRRNRLRESIDGWILEVVTELARILELPPSKYLTAYRWLLTGRLSAFQTVRHALFSDFLWSDAADLINAWDQVHEPLTNVRVSPRTIVCLCGSTRWYKVFDTIGLKETLEGNIVLSIGSASGSDDSVFYSDALSSPEKAAIKDKLDRLHLDKIDLADEVIILNVSDYIGESTRRELAHARERGKPIFWLVYPSIHAVDGERARY